MDELLENVSLTYLNSVRATRKLKLIKNMFILLT